MKMKRNLIILAVVLVLAVGLVFVAPRLKPSTGAGASPSPTATVDPATLQFVSYSADKVQEVTVENASGTFTLVKQGDKYVLKDDPSLELDQTNALAIFNAVAAVTGDRVVAENPADLAPYGLEKPTAKATVKYADGKTAVFLMGDVTPTSAARYVMMQGDPRLMMVAGTMGDALQRTEASLLYREPNPVTSDIIDSVVVKKNDQVVLELAKDTKSQVSIYTWMMKKPWYHAADQTAITTLTDAAVAVQFDDAVEGNATDLAKYGLDKPSGEFIVSGGGKTFDVLVGKDKDVNTSYAMLAGGKTVYALPKSRYSFTETKPEELMDMMIMLVDVKHAVSAEFNGFGQSGKLGVQQVPELDDKGVQKKDGNGLPMFEQKFTLNGKAQDAAIARTYYQEVIGLTAHSMLPEGWKPSGTPLATLTYTRDIAPKTIKLEFFAYDKDFYAVVIDETPLFKIKQEKVKQVADDLGKFLAGKLTAAQ